MGEKLAWDEIARRYPDEWVALEEPDWPETPRPLSGVVIAHHPNRRRFYAMLSRVRHPRRAIVFTGKRPYGPLLAFAFARVEHVDRKL